MKIYTRKGDQGDTSLIGGTRVPKHHLRIEAYGTVDELNAWIGVLRDQPINAAHRNFLMEIQDRLFVIGSHLANDPATSKMKLPLLNQEDIVALENAMDEMDGRLPEMKNFVLPGGHTIVSFCHVARCVCRRAERCTVHLSEQEPVDSLILQYLNRLSDFLFVLSRMLTQELDAAEIPWKPRH
jgi:cob(I)alamin adenosyltransferase